MLGLRSILAFGGLLGIMPRAAGPVSTIPPVPFAGHDAFPTPPIRTPRVLAPVVVSTNPKRQAQKAQRAARRINRKNR